MHPTFELKLKMHDRRAAPVLIYSKGLLWPRELRSVSVFFSFSICRFAKPDDVIQLSRFNGEASQQRETTGRDVLQKLKKLRCRCTGCEWKFEAT